MINTWFHSLLSRSGGVLHSPEHSTRRGALVRGRHDCSERTLVSIIVGRVATWSVSGGKVVVPDLIDMFVWNPASPVRDPVG